MGNTPTTQKKNNQSSTSTPSRIQVQPFQGSALSIADKSSNQTKQASNASSVTRSVPNLSQQQLEKISHSTLMLQSRMGSTLSGLAGDGEDETLQTTTYQSADGTIYTTYVDQESRRRFYFDFEKNVS